MNKPLLYLSVVCFLIANINWISAQDSKQNYALLWKITGNGLEKPSYIFGSMHVRDEAVFNFCDSMFIAMNSCEAFANEIHFDSAMMTMIEVMTEDEKFFNQSRASKEKKEKDRAGRIAKKDFAIERNKTQMATVLDAHLFNIAKELGKDIYGLERIDESIEMIKDNVGFENDFLSFLEDPSYPQFLQDYSAGNLDAIEDHIGEYEKEMEDLKLIERNYIQAKSIEKIIKEKSLFAVIGAAHLIGEEGVVELLKKRGYHLRPVQADFTGMADQFTYKPIPQKWHTNSSKNEDFNFQTRIPAYRVKAFEGFMDFHFACDIGKGLLSMVLGMNNQYASLEGPILLDTLEKTFVLDGRYDLLSTSDFTHKDIKGREYIMADWNQELEYFRIRLLTHQGKVFILYAAAFKYEQLTHPDIEHYFDSFEFFEKKEEKFEWELVKNDTAAFKTQFPTNGKFYKKQTENPLNPEGAPYIMHFCQKSRDEPEELYLYRYNDLPVGYYHGSDSTAFNTFKNILIDKGAKLLTEEDDSYKGYPVKNLEFDRAGFLFKLKIFLRGNRTYVLEEVKDMNAPISDFIDSFEFIPFQKMNMSKQVLVDSTIAIFLPTEPILEVDNYELTSSREKDYTYHSKDPFSGTLFTMVVNKFRAYHSVEDKDSVFIQLENEVLEDADSVYYNKEISITEKVKAKSILLTRKFSSVHERYLVFIYNNNLYYLIAYLPKELVDDEMVNQYFEPDLLIPANEEIDMFADKGALILKDIRSRDSLTYTKAKTALNYHIFKPKHLPQIYKILEFDFAVDNLSDDVRDQLIAQFQYTKDETTIPFLKKYFQKKEEKSKSIKIIETLAALQTPEGFAASFDLLDELPADYIEDRFIENYTKIFNDSIEFFKTYYPRFKTLAKKGTLINEYFYLLETAVADTSFNSDFIKNDSVFIAQLADEIVSIPATTYRTKHLRHFLMYYYLSIDAKPIHVKQVRQTASEDTPWLRYRAVYYLITKGKDVDQQILNATLQDSTYYYSTLDLLKKNKKLELVPEKLMNQEQIATAMIKYLFNYYDGSPVEFKLFDTRIVRYQSKDQRVYLFHYTVLDAKKNEDGTLPKRLATAGPFPIDESQKDFSEDLADWSNKEIVIKELGKQIEEFIEWMIDNQK